MQSLCTISTYPTGLSFLFSFYFPFIFPLILSVLFFLLITFLLLFFFSSPSSTIPSFSSFSLFLLSLPSLFRVGAQSQSASPRGAGSGGLNAGLNKSEEPNNSAGMMFILIFTFFVCIWLLCEHLYARVVIVTYDWYPINIWNIFSPPLSTYLHHLSFPPYIYISTLYPFASFFHLSLFPSLHLFPTSPTPTSLHPPYLILHPTSSTLPSNKQQSF